MFVYLLAKFTFYNTVEDTVYYLQSSEESSSKYAESSAEDTHQNVAFADAVDGNHTTAAAIRNDVARVDGTSDIQLGQFFSRPTLIQTYTWTEGGGVGELLAFNPWVNYFSNTVIQRKLHNFQFMRCKLKLKVLVNASPFYYGLVILNYNPLEGNSWNPARDSTNTYSILAPYSQFPHIEILPSASSGGCLEIPYFYPYNWLPCGGSGTNTLYGNLGTARLVAYTGLSSANGAVGQGVTIQIYAWAEDVELMGPTQNLAIQSGDEYGSSPVSKMAASVAAASGKLTSAPIIGKYARATEIGAKATKDVADLFGFSKPPVVDDVHNFMNVNLPHLASAYISTPVQKLTLDPKTELSISNELAGDTEKDPLQISEIVQKPSFIMNNVWNTADAFDTVIASFLVNPALSYPAVVGANSSVVNMSPMAWAAYNFNYWRGTIKIRVKVIASKFHKGRLRITYDPLANISNTSDSQNTAYNHIIDIGKDDDIWFEIPYHQAPAYSIIRTPTDTMIQQGPGSLPPTINKDNGSLTVRVLTQLSAPVATAPVYLLFYVCGGNDLEFALPSNENGDSGPTISPFKIQSEEEIIPMIDTVNIGPKSITFGSPGKLHGDRYGFNMGECYRSLRPLMTRTNYVESVPENGLDSNLSGNSYITYRQLFGRMPLIPGFDPNGMNTATGPVSSATKPYNFVRMNSIVWNILPFKAYRGSFDWHFNIDNSGNFRIDNFQIYRHSSSRSTSDRAGKIVGNVSSTAITLSKRYKYLNSQNAYNGTGGAAVVSQVNNAAISVNLPDYNPANFRLQVPSNYVAGVSSSNLTTDFTDNDTYGMVVRVNCAASNSTSGNMSSLIIDKLANIGTDFHLLYFIAVPTMDIYNSVPAAV